MSRCTGHCCERFYVDLERLTDTNADNIRDGDQIRGMLIDIEPHNDDDGGWWCTCVHFNTETRNCNDYDNRPHMCSAYPYGGKCSYEQCTMSCEAQAATKPIEV